MADNRDSSVKLGDALLKVTIGKSGALNSGSIRVASSLAEGVVIKNTTDVLRLRGGVSQGSDCDSDGVPCYMQDYCDDVDMELIQARREVEDFPILIVGGGRKEEESSNNQDLNVDEEGNLSPRSAKRWLAMNENQTDVSKLKGVSLSSKEALIFKNGGGTEAVIQSSSGGIPVQEVTVEECESSDEESFKVSDLEAMERSTVHRATKMAYAVNKQDREDLSDLRKKMQEVHVFLAKRGFSMADIEKEQIVGENEFNSGSGVHSAAKFVTGRDEFGLPIFVKDGNIVGARGGNVKDSGCVSGVKDVFGKEKTEKMNKVFADLSRSKPISGEDIAKMKRLDSEQEQSKGKVDNGNKKSWSQILKDDPPKLNDLKFEYYPLPEGTDVVEPPVEILMKGVEKFKCCIIGQFSKKTLPFSRVCTVAKNAWEKKGMTDVFQKSSSVFVFKFNSLAAKNAILSQGTWYFDKNPLVVTDWGATTVQITEMPIWIKLSNVPDCYWTEEGIGRLASVIGRPLCADNLTSQLNILPFAKVCVQYKVGDPLPEKIKAIDFNPSSSAKTIVEVEVAYQQKPKVCLGCKSLGHVISACPVTIRKWVRKMPTRQSEDAINSTSDEGVAAAEAIGDHIVEAQENFQTPTTGIEKNTSSIEIDIAEKVPVSEKNAENASLKEDEWTEVRKKTSSASKTQDQYSDVSVSPTVFKGLKRVDEVDKKRGISLVSPPQKLVPGLLSKSQQKRLKKAKGKSPN